MSHLREGAGVSELQVKLVLIQTLLCLKLSSDACTLHYTHKNGSRERLCVRLRQWTFVCVFAYILQNDMEYNVFKSKNKIISLCLPASEKFVWSTKIFKHTNRF